MVYNLCLFVFEIHESLSPLSLTALMSSRSANLSFHLVSAQTRVHKRVSQDGSPLPGRTIPVRSVHQNGRMVAKSACFLPGLTVQQKRACHAQKQDTMVAKKDRAMRKKLAKSIRTTSAAAVNYTGYLVLGQWDGMTFPIVQWALDITRQATLEYPFVPDEQQLQLLLPTKQGPASKPTFTAYTPLSRNFYLVTDENGYAGQLFGINIAPDVNSSTYTYPRQVFKYSNTTNLMTMAGLETVYLNGQEIVLVFFTDGHVSQVCNSVLILVRILRFAC
jgi:hypothetical protein